MPEEVKSSADASSAAVSGELRRDDYWTIVNDETPYAQGDILRRFTSNDPDDPEFGLIITADCDIAQAKAADRLTYVEVVSTRTYLETIWIPDQLQKFVKKQSAAAAQALAGVMRRSELSFELLDEQLVEWLRQRPVEAVDKAVNRTGKALDGRLVQNLNALRCALGAEGHATPLAQWRALRTTLGDSKDRQLADLTSALAGGGGFPDFFLLPELPGASGLGYVALLRFIRTVHSHEVFASEVDARVQGHPHALHRVGCLTDGIRFAVTQKLAFLFSRIGLPTSFENASKSAAALAAESLFTGV
ncbi:MAG: hypothetical protein EON55_00210 [Alphaproteobacteria bacterium]|nr:MAG: hypothetical protein EON55_00210 [Alphaproteobacteria bacterium]